jgi:HPt (histidine-containing phosphotransfer) domain-containing protein
MIVINPFKLNELRKFMSKQQIIALLHSFLDPTISGKEKLILAFQEGNPTRIKEMSHSLRGAASFIGVQSIVDYCQKIELQLSEDPMTPLKELFLGFEQTWIETELGIKQVIANDFKQQ